MSIWFSEPSIERINAMGKGTLVDCSVSTRPKKSVSGWKLMPTMFVAPAAALSPAQRAPCILAVQPRSGKPKLSMSKGGWSAFRA
jgi:hypothetical protein